MESKLVASLKSDVPAIVMIGLDANVFYGYQKDNTAVDEMPPHYVIVTGIEIDHITGKTVLEVATWSDKAYIDLENYLNNPGILGSVIVVAP